MAIVSRPGNQKYRENYDRIFGNRQVETEQVETGFPCSKCGKPLRALPDNYRGRSPKCLHCGYQDMRK